MPQCWKSTQWWKWWRKERKEVGILCLQEWLMWDIGKGKLMFMKWYVGSFVEPSWWTGPMDRITELIFEFIVYITRLLSNQVYWIGSLVWGLSTMTAGWLPNSYPQVIATACGQFSTREILKGIHSSYFCSEWMVLGTMWSWSAVQSVKNVCFVCEKSVLLFTMACHCLWLLWAQHVHTIRLW